MKNKLMPFENRPNRHDQKCPDGFVCNGYRRINKGGYVRFSSDRHYHVELAKYVGEWVFVELDDPYGIHVNIWLNKPWQSGVRPLAAYNEREWMLAQKT
ncbi:hypothetical protein [Undibacterium oligocarboniphilum]|uniref:hypothetical protein n=1 Tax=Undibacterium oligocarboniphilum TaxID=666702 RepID=UPI001685F63B|nr:hypothetical protein [Undibacterium oligocarboniphilum]MBC3871763.1 hypothetical protein [Undibacterium oligocarboniphilum]